MVLSADLIGLILYCVQQLGVTLGVGSQTILLAAYLISMRDGVVDSKEAQFHRAIRGVLNTGIACIIISGIGITAMQLMTGEAAIVLTPAYLFKCLLIVLALVLTIVSKDSTRSIVYGIAGGTWFALFLVHILAPVTTWSNLFILYAVWMVGFLLCWEGLAFFLRDKTGHLKAPITPNKIPAKETLQKPPPVAPVMLKVEMPAPPPFPPIVKKETLPSAPPAPQRVPKIPPAPPPNLPSQQVPVITPNRVVPSPSNVVVSNSNTLPLQKEPFSIAPMSQPPGPTVVPPKSSQTPAINSTSELPTIQVMPKNPGDLKK